MTDDSSDHEDTLRKVKIKDIEHLFQCSICHQPFNEATSINECLHTCK